MHIELLSFEEMFMVVLRTMGIFIWAFILLRILGRRRLAHLTYIDLLLVIAFGSAVGDVMIYPESTTRFFVSLIALTAVAVLVRALDELSSRSVLGNHLIDGRARIIIERGKALPAALGAENITEDDLCSLLREKDVDSVEKVKKAFIEPDGELSVILYKRNRR